MPELPEVEVVKRGLQNLKDRIIKKIVVTNFANIKLDPRLQDISSLKVEAIERNAKYIIFKLTSLSQASKLESTNHQDYIVFHLGMTGSLIFPHNPAQYTFPHTQLIIYFEESIYPNILVFTDIRKFGSCKIMDHNKLKNLFAKNGLDPFDTNFNEQYLFSQQNNSSIKNFLMNNHIVTGIGNIYANEILLKSKINPHRKSSNITLEQYQTLFLVIREILTSAINYGGSSIKDFKDPHEQRGEYQNRLLIYGRKECGICRRKTEKTYINQRSTYHCNICQS